MNTEQTQEEPQTQEVLVYRHYRRLRNQAKDLNEQADEIRDTEIIPDMESGLVFGEGDGYIRFEYQESVKFDHKKARAEGAISDEVWTKYVSVEVTRKVMPRSYKDETQEAGERQLAAHMARLSKAVRGGKEIDVIMGPRLESFREFERSRSISEPEA